MPYTWAHNWVSLLLSLLVLPAVTFASERPNLVVIVVDDQRFDEYGAAGHSYLETPNIDQLAREGTRFTSAYATTPLCSPNRASILTGQYASRHGIVDNIARDLSSHRLNLFAIALQAAGYDTAHVGKWHMGNDPTARPGYNYWVGLPGQGRSIDPLLYEEGAQKQVNGYLTDILTDRAIGFIERERDKPFFLYLGHKAIHPDIIQNEDASVDLSKPRKFVPAPRHEGRYKNAVFPKRKNYYASDEQIAKKPVLKKALAARNAMGVDLQSKEQTIRDRAEMLLAVDESLGKIIDALQSKGILDNTAILFTSDNGYFYGEHRLSVERRMPYEEAVHVPMLLRYPKLVAANKEIDDFVLSIDIAPSMLELAQARIGEHIQGKSFIPLLAGDSRKKDWREAFLIEYMSFDKPMPWLVNTSYKVVRTRRYKYIHWIHHPQHPELYDLSSDPYELNNRINDPELAGTRLELVEKLNTLSAFALGLP